MIRSLCLSQRSYEIGRSSHSRGRSSLGGFFFRTVTALAPRCGRRSGRLAGHRAQRPAGDGLSPGHRGPRRSFLRAKSPPGTPAPFGGPPKQWSKRQSRSWLRTRSRKICPSRSAVPLRRNETAVQASLLAGQGLETAGEQPVRSIEKAVLPAIYGLFLPWWIILIL